MPPGLSRDTVVVKRRGATVDAEGNPNHALTTVATGKGTWGTPSNRDQRAAQQRGQQVDAVVATELSDVRPGDRVTVRAADWDVVAVADARIHWRLFLRRVDA